ncbi:uncharacterized protein BDW70DRAFT_159503 [Aspergillus foveolatus]|uniref:uncharacterized protein n=1 Tax=Aspergillus foveolatus TaxID=210207 RepID=UPI003CCCB7B7
MFAKWWSTQDLLGDKTHLDGPSRLKHIQSEIASAISARYIMNIYRALAKMLPDLILAAARACIVADYPNLFAEPPTSSFRPTLFMMREVGKSHNPFFVADPKRIAAELGIKTENRHTWNNENRLYDFDMISDGQAVVRRQERGDL